MRAAAGPPPSAAPEAVTATLPTSSWEAFVPFKILFLLIVWGRDGLSQAWAVCPSRLNSDLGLRV